MIENFHESLKPYFDRVEKGYLSTCVKNDLILFKYTDSCVYDKAWDEYTINARGLILNIKTGELVSKALPKFFNIEEMNQPSLPYYEQYLTAMKTNMSYEVFDKVDGSAGVSFIDSDGLLSIATLGSFFSDQAVEATKMFRALPMHPSLNPDYTYFFEIIYPENKIVVDYKGKRELVLLTMIETKTGKEVTRNELEWYAITYGLTPVEKYYLTIEEMITLQKTLPKDREGFVVRFENGLRIKIKGDEYLKIHKALSGCTPLNIWREFKEGKLPDEYKTLMPEEVLPEINKIEESLMMKYRMVMNDIIYDNLQFPVYMVPLSKDDRKHVGLLSKALWNELNHPKAVFPFLDQNSKGLEKYIMNVIRPSGNQL